MLHRAEDSNPGDVREGRMLGILAQKAVVVPRQALGHGQEALYKGQETAQSRGIEAWNSILHPKDYRHKAMAGRGYKRAVGAGRVDVDRGHVALGWEPVDGFSIHPKKHQELMREPRGLQLYKDR